MKWSDERWRLHAFREGAEERLGRLQGRFKTISRGYERRRMRPHRALRWGAVLALVIASSAGTYLVLQISPWPAMTTLRHIAAAPSCGAARLVGLAPAIRGQPGYWRFHDADRDNVACEPEPIR